VTQHGTNTSQWKLVKKLQAGWKAVLQRGTLVAGCRTELKGRVWQTGL